MLDSSFGKMRLPPLTTSEIQVWRIDLDSELPAETELIRSFSAEEVERVGRIRHEETRRQFLAGRACLRMLLGAAFRIAADLVEIGNGAYGKPGAAPVNGICVHFNVAHSRSTVLIAMSLAGPVGIDVEYLDRRTEVLEVARHTLTESETGRVMAIGEVARRNRAFFECWTRKEAAIKADGRGLSLPLTSFEVPVDEPCVASPVELPGVGDDAPRRYFISDVALGEDVACAIAIADKAIGYRIFDLPNEALDSQE